MIKQSDLFTDFSFIEFTVNQPIVLIVNVVHFAQDAHITHRNTATRSSTPANAAKPNRRRR